LSQLRYSGGKGKPESPAIRQIMVTDSIPVSIDEWSRSRGIKAVSLAPILAAAIRRNGD
jgi:phosphoribosylpyrophosphate synthetase